MFIYTMFKKYIGYEEEKHFCPDEFRRDHIKFLQELAEDPNISLKTEITIRKEIDRLKYTTENREMYNVKFFKNYDASQPKSKPKTIPIDPKGIELKNDMTQFWIDIIKEHRLTENNLLFSPSTRLSAKNARLNAEEGLEQAIQSNNKKLIALQKPIFGFNEERKESDQFKK
jgi:hypothetical protein